MFNNEFIRVLNVYMNFLSIIIAIVQEITSLCWCPDGDVLAVGTDHGFLYLLDYECGKLIFAWRFVGFVLFE